MNGNLHPNFLMKHLLKWPAACGLLALLLAQPALAGQDSYINDKYTINPGNIDATNFINNNYFSSGTFFPYETTDTLNYTNNDTMTGFGGFLFDTMPLGNPASRHMAANFYNPGTVTVGSGANLLVNVTNIVSPGTLDVGGNGGLFLTGQNVDLSYATLTLEQPTYSPPGSGSFGSNTNATWDPSLKLTAASATSSDPIVFTAAPSQAYSDTQNPSPTNVLIEAVFLSNQITNDITTKVYFTTNTINGGSATVEWDGTYLDTATGLTKTNYLYLSNNYFLGASTNVTFNNGIPSNFQLSQPTAADPSLTKPASIKLPTFPAGAITNPYSYAQIQLVPTTVATGPTASNPTGAITNLPARIQINAANELNLALSTITGPNLGQGANYMSIICTNQFDGAAGARIVSPYTDLNLGVTNGFLTISNLIQSYVPTWVGSIQAWSTRWTVTDTNGTTDYRVLIVSSSIVPKFSSPQVQNLTLHGTNLVVSDALNIMNSPSIDAQSLTLTANGAGAGSPDGELNFESSSTLFASSLPNLRWLTNNGTITLGNNGIFGGPSPANYLAFVNNGFVADSGSAIYSSYFTNSGSIFNGSGNFFLQSQTADFGGGRIVASTGDIAITADDLLMSGVSLQAGRSLTLQAANSLTDGGASNKWTVGASSLVGLNLPILPASGDLLGTTISVLASTNKNVVNTWAGADRGVSALGYNNNAALGSLILDARSVPPHSLLTFKPATGTNALYVVNLYLTNTAATLAGGNASALSINANMTLYYQNAYSNGVPVSSTIDGWNGGRLRWVNPVNFAAQASIVLVEPLDPPESFSFKVPGVQVPSGLLTGPNYQVIIQAATNILSPNWVNVYTGTPPFTFDDFAFKTNHQQFYRAKQGW